MAEKRVLVLGSNLKSKSVSSFLWHAIPDSLNPADFDAIILNFDPLQRGTDIFPDEIGPLDRMKLAPFLFKTSNELIVIGSAQGLRAWTWLSGKKSEGKRSAVAMLPTYPTIQDSSGDTVECTDDDWRWYFDNVGR
jgi:hypothetical protein